MSLHNRFNPIGNKHDTHREHQYPIRYLRALVVSCLILMLSPAYGAEDARSSKSKQNDNKPYPVNISADQLVSQTKAGQSEYRGKVLLTRHKFEASGESLKLIHPNDRLQTATIVGNPATFKDFMPKKQQWVNGEAKNILFDQEKDTITLLDNASIMTDKGNQIKADKIILYNKTETFEALGNKKQGTRVQMVLQPEN
jgi:lipopolysaccharide export system protein LptA